MSNHAFELAIVSVAAVFMVAIALIIKGAFSPAHSLKPASFREALDAYRNANTKGEKVLIVVLVFWPEDKKAQLILWTAIAAVITAVASLIGLPGRLLGKENEGFARGVAEKFYCFMVSYLDGK